ncbi:MAG: hypothetical protein RLZZ200_1996 [Pseudomonadota bacterium]|jgi:hypothetical protein
MRRSLVAALLAGLGVSTSVASAASTGVIELPRAKFATGDDMARARADFDDSKWAELSTTLNFEKQGFEDYDGYAWYRIHVRIPSSLKSSVKWAERLRIYLSSIDDVDETFLNGVKIGAMGQMPGDPRGYATRWNGLREYDVGVSSGLVRWDEDNVIAIRLYDGSGGGGFYRDMPTLRLAEIVEGFKPDTGKTRYDYAGPIVKASVHWANSFPVAMQGRLDQEVFDADSGKVLSRGSRGVAVAPNSGIDLPVQAPQRAGIEVRYTFTEAKTGAVGRSVLNLPYLLTPAESARPRINGATVLGARPGSPIYYRLPATGRSPLKLGARDLPAGLAFDPAQGVISGRVAMAGEYRITLTASNALGEAQRVLTLIVGDMLALTPPMGWNSWNVYGLAVDAAKVRAVADAMVSTGLAAHGWTYVNIDDGWESAQRNADGSIGTNSKFPDMKALSDDLHAKGLRFGIYSSPGPLTCGRFLGSLGHERQDADTWASWGVDYLKYDLCSYETTNLPKNPSVADHRKPYEIMGKALAAQSRDIVFSLCQYGSADVWNWGREVGGSLWRTTGDIEDSWRLVREIMEAQVKSAPFAGPGRWNDPDMLVVGEVGWGGELHPTRITPDEQYTHISYWSLLAAPLLLGNDLTRLDAFTRNLLVNDEVMAVNQDPLGRAARKAWSGDGWEIWERELADGRKAVGVFNFGEAFRSLKIAGRVPELTAGVALRDLWRQKDLAALSEGFEARVPAHGVLLLAVGKGR